MQRGSDMSSLTLAILIPLILLSASDLSFQTLAVLMASLPLIIFLAFIAYSAVFQGNFSKACFAGAVLLLMGFGSILLSRAVGE